MPRLPQMEQEEQAGAMSHDSLAHLHLQRLAARFSPAAVTNVSYDDGNALLLVTERVRGRESVPL